MSKELTFKRAKYYVSELRDVDFIELPTTVHVDSIDIKFGNKLDLVPGIDYIVELAEGKILIKWTSDGHNYPLYDLIHYNNCIWFEIMYVDSGIEDNDYPETVEPGPSSSSSSDEPEPEPSSSSSGDSSSSSSVDPDAVINEEKYLKLLDFLNNE